MRVEVWRVEFVEIAEMSESGRIDVQYDMILLRRKESGCKLRSASIRTYSGT